MKRDETKPMAMWLPVVISILCLVEGAIRFAEPLSSLNKATIGTTSRPAIASAYFNGANFIVFGVLGLGCVFWPTLSRWICCKREYASEKKQQVEVVVVTNCKRQADGEKAVISQTGGEEESKESKAQAGNKQEVATSKKCQQDVPAPPKRQVTYLTNLKTFLTFVVVTFHVVQLFAVEALGGIYPTSYVGQNNVNTSQSFTTLGTWFNQVSGNYFMAAFYLISGYFCPKSFDRKGFRFFVIDKLVRLGGPLVLWTMFINPIILSLSTQAMMGFPLEYVITGFGYTSNISVCWFILWLLNFSIVYAVIGQFGPKLECRMPHPLALLPLGMALSGIYYGMVVGASDAQQQYYNLGTMSDWSFGICLYIPFFAAGTIGGRNDWLKSIEEMSVWVIWTLRVIVVGFWVTIFLAVAQDTIPIPGLHMDVDLFQSLVPPVYAIPMTLAIIQFFHQYCNATPQSKLALGAGQAAYMVYVFQKLPMIFLYYAYMNILKASGMPIIPTEIGTWVSVAPDGQTSYLSDGYIWGGFFFVLVLTQLILWPLCFYLRKAPVLNKMF